MVARRTLLGATAGGLAAAGLPLLGEQAAWAEVPLDNQMITDTQWSNFLRGQDLLWRRLPPTWKEGPFLGDGRLGVMVYKEPSRNQVRFSVQHGEVQDHRPQYGSLYGLARLPVGHLTLEPVGTITSVDWRQSLWDAELSGTVTTSSGQLTLRAFVHDQVLIATVSASGSEQVRWVFHPAQAISPRVAFEPPPSGYTGHPAPTTKQTGNVKQVTQNLLGGGQTATAYKESGGSLYLTIAHSFPSTTAEATALNRANAAGPALLDANRAWWHAYYRKSFVSIPDQRLQSFHWIQLYKVAAGSRAGGPVMATTGPWLEPTPWPGVWWNLNVQLEYWLIHGSNHLELDAITSTIQSRQQQLINNVGSAYRSDSSGLGRSSDMFCQRSVGTPGSGAEVGDLTWTLHNIWLSYRHTMDDNLLRDLLFPVLKRAINYYRHFLTTGSDGKLHLGTTLSPEYPTVAPDCNYDLALIRWGCQTLLEASTRLGINDPLRSAWQNILTNLVPYPTDVNGFMIGAGVPYARSHRHYSHILMVYPLYLVNWDQPAQRTLIEKTIVRWHALTGAHRGYSYTGAASMYSMMGRGDTALNYLLRFFDISTSYPCLPNTMYTEAGPVVETPLSASQTIHDMLCQSWGGIVRVFPAVPSSWGNATLHDFRTQGAFLVSASRNGGVTKFVRVRSLAGEPLRLKHGINSGSSSTVYQAESATISQGVVESNHTGFAGTGFVNMDNVVGSYVEFAVSGPATSVTVRYANGTTVNRPMSVNGSTVDFPGTGAWTTWATKSIPVSLGNGTHAVRLTSSTATGGPNLDRLDVVPQSDLSVTLDGGAPATWRDFGDGVIEIDLLRDREVLVHAAGPTPALTIAPVPISVPGSAWGLPT